MGEFVENIACPKCSKSGEGKSLSVYTDGSYCNECGHRESTNSDNSVSKPKKTGIKDITVVPFKTRGLTADTVRQYNSGGYTSSTGSYRVFNYTDESGVVYAQKFKNVENKSDMFKLGDTRRTGLFGPRHLNPDKGRFCIVCYLPSTEVLTQDGWKAFEDLSDTDYVTQVSEDGAAELVLPTGYVDKHYDGTLIQYKSGPYSMTCTEDHAMVRVVNGKNTRVGSREKIHLPIPRTVNSFSSKNSCKLSDNEIKMLVMFSADFTLRHAGDIYGCFRKSRKISRAAEILDSCGVIYSSNIEPSSGKTNFYISRKQLLADFFMKEFDHNLILSMDDRQRRVFIEELVHWDGNTVPNRAQIEYSTKIEKNAEIVQTVSHLCGYVSTIIKRSNKFGTWYKVSILLNKKTSSTQQGYKEVNYSGRVMCVNVPSKMLLVRHEKSISISGNCEGEEDAMAVYQATGYAAFSIPNGADSAVKTFEAEFEYLNGWQYVVLFFDNDEAGKKAAEKASKVLPIGKARIATPTLKDANEMLLNGQKDKIKGCLWKAREIRPEGVIKGSEIDWNDIVKELPTGVDILYPGLSKAMRGLHKRRITLVTAQPKAGKSTICREIAYDLVVNKRMKVGNIFLEEDQRETVKSYVAIDNNVPHYKVWEKPLDYIDPENPPQYLNNDNIAFFNHFGSLDSKKLLDAIRYMHYVMAVDYVILDHISIVVSGMSSEQGERKDIDILMTSLRSLVQETGVGVVAVCHIKQMKDTDPVTMHSLRGSGSLAQLSDFVVGVEKALDQEGKEIQDTRTVNVLANRYTGMTGQVDTLYYNRNTGRLLPISSNEDLDDDEDFTI